MKSAADNNPIRTGTWGGNGSLPCEISERASLKRSLKKALDQKANAELLNAVRAAEVEGLAVDLANARRDARNNRPFLEKSPALEGKLAEFEEQAKRDEERIEKAHAMIERQQSEAMALRDGFAEERKILLLNSQTIIDERDALARSLKGRDNELKATTDALARSLKGRDNELKATTDALARSLKGRDNELKATTDALLKERQERLDALGELDGLREDNEALSGEVESLQFVARFAIGHLMPDTDDGHVHPASTKAAREALMGAVKTPLPRSDRKGDASTIPAEDVKHLRESLAVPPGVPVAVIVAATRCEACGDLISEEGRLNFRTRCGTCSKAPARPVRGRVSP